MTSIDQEQCSLTCAEPSSVVTQGHQAQRDPNESDAIYQIETTYGFTPLMITFGTAYFRRLAASNEAMLQVALASPNFNPLVTFVQAQDPGKLLVGAVHAQYLPTNEAWLTLIHLTCTYLAAKNLEFVPYQALLQTMIGHIYGVDPCQVNTRLVSDLELECLDALDWKLEMSTLHSGDDAEDSTTEKADLPSTQDAGAIAESADTLADSAEPTSDSDMKTPAPYSDPEAQSDLPRKFALEEGKAATSPEPLHSSSVKADKALVKSAVPNFDEAVHAWHGHRAVQWAWLVFGMLLLLATCFNMYLMLVAFLPMLLGQQIALSGLAFLRMDSGKQQIRAGWFFKVQQTGAIIMAACSAAFAAVVAAFVVQCSQGRAPCELLHDGIFGVPVESFIGVGYALHAVLSVKIAKNAHQVQHILEKDIQNMAV